MWISFPKVDIFLLKELTNIPVPDLATVGSSLTTNNILKLKKSTLSTYHIYIVSKIKRDKLGYFRRIKP